MFVRLIAGEYDDQLKWPFVGNISIELLNWIEDKAHLKTTCSIAANDGFAKFTRTESVLGEVIGNQFIAHSLLTYNRNRNVKYLQEDCLRFRVNVNINN